MQQSASAMSETTMPNTSIYSNKYICVTRQICGVQRGL